MFRRLPGTVTGLAAVVAAAALTLAAAGAHAAAPAAAKYERWATITTISGGYYYDAGQQDTHLVITRVQGGVRFADTHTDVLRSKPDACRREPAQTGIVVVCRVPASVDAAHPMTVKVFTRLGNDFIDSSALPRAFELYMLADQGNDVVVAGAGDDFVNGAPGVDQVWGGPGDDWIRTGLDDDVIWGGPGSDRLVGVDGRDKIHGGTGDDRVGGGSGNDRLFAGDGTDFVLCGTGRDAAHTDRADRIMADCESVQYARR